MELPRSAAVALIAAAALLMNVPLGRVRARTRRLSTRWFLCVHLSIPVIYLLRKSAHLSLWAIAVFIPAAVVGQLLGGRLSAEPAVCEG
jgi:hypothetical protein